MSYDEKIPPEITVLEHPRMSSIARFDEPTSRFKLIFQDVTSSRKGKAR